MTTSELHDALRDEVARFTPPSTPAFAGVVAAHRRGRRRRVLGAALAAVLVGGAGAVAVGLPDEGPDPVVASSDGTSLVLDEEPLTGVSICRTSPLGRCWTFAASEARELARALQDGAVAGDQLGSCSSIGGDSYRASLLPPGRAGTVIDVVVPPYDIQDCEHSRIDGVAFTIDVPARRLVGEIYSSAGQGSPSVATEYGTCAAVAYAGTGARVRLFGGTTSALDMVVGEELVVEPSGVCPEDVFAVDQQPGVLEHTEGVHQRLVAVVPGTVEVVVERPSCSGVAAMCADPRRVQLGLLIVTVTG